VQDGDQRGLAAHQRAGDVEAVLEQERVEVVAGHPARDVREAAPDLVRVPVPQPAQRTVDRRSAVAVLFDLAVLVVAGFTAPEPGSVIEQSFQSGDVVNDLAGALRGGAAGVVADHAADRAVGMGRGLRAVPQPVPRQFAVERVQDDARFDDAGARGRVDGHEPVAVLRPVDHHGGVGALAGQTAPTAAREHGHVVFTAHRDRVRRGVDAARHDDADRYLAEVGRVGRVSAPGAGVETHLCVDAFPEGGLDCGQVRHARVGLVRWADRRRPPQSMEARCLRGLAVHLDTEHGRDDAGGDHE
jgi:hypothetical protein